MRNFKVNKTLAQSNFHFNYAIIKNVLLDIMLFWNDERQLFMYLCSYKFMHIYKFQMHINVLTCDDIFIFENIKELSTMIK